MFRRQIASLAVGLSLLAASTAVAQQTVQMNVTTPYAPFGSAVVSPFGYYMSPYGGTVGTDNNVRLNCVDFFHHAYINQPWTVFKTNLGALAAAVGGGNLAMLAYTRDGANGLYSPMDAVNVYKQVAWLTDQYATNPGSNGTRTTAIQTAIWAIANNRPNNAFTALNQYIGTTSTSSTSDLTTGYWIGQAQSQYVLQSSNYYDKFYILTDANFQTATDGGRQEFIYSATPEPGTLALIGTGVAALAARARRRKKVTEPSDDPALA
jgi:hypothetical protein